MVQIHLPVTSNKRLTRHIFAPIPKEGIATEKFTLYFSASGVQIHGLSRIFTAEYTTAVFLPTHHLAVITGLSYYQMHAVNR